MPQNSAKKILVVAHDAGGAEIIGAYIKKHQTQFDFHCYVAGPALKIFRRLDIPSKKITIFKKDIDRIVAKHADAKFVLLGTGWMTTIELTALTSAKTIGLKTVVYLEAWWNYRERFEYPKKHWKDNLPDEIWVGDRYAEAIAKKCFPKTHIKFSQNQYFVSIKEEFKKLKKKDLKQKKNIVFLSDCTPEAHVALSQLLRTLSEKKSPQNLRIRFHPADDRSRYDELIAQYKSKIHIKKSSQKDITRDLLDAKLVIGTETVAMAVSVVVGVKTISIKKAKEPFLLPFKEIIQVQNIKDLSSLI